MPPGPPTKFTAHHLQPPATRPTKQTQPERKQWEIEGVGKTGGLVLIFYYLNNFSTKLLLYKSQFRHFSTFPLLLPPMASSLFSKPFLGSSRTEGFSGLSSLSTDLSKLSFSAVKISVGSRNAKKLRMFFFYLLLYCISFAFSMVEFYFGDFVG